MVVVNVKKPVMVFPLLCWQSSEVARFPVAPQVSWETEAVVITDSDQRHYFTVTVNQSWLCLFSTWMNYQLNKLIHLCMSFLCSIFVQVFFIFCILWHISIFIIFSITMPSIGGKKSSPNNRVWATFSHSIRKLFSRKGKCYVLQCWRVI